MRVTQKMLNTQMLRNLSNNLGRMDKLQNDYSSGTKIHAPSDDPVGIGFSLRYRSELAANEQYQKNVDSALSWLEYSDKLMGQINSVMDRARDLAVQGANGSMTDIAMESIAKEVSQLYEQLVQIGNSKFNGKYVFNGQMTDQPPYTIANAPLEQTDSGEIIFQIGIGENVPVNLTGEQVFGSAGTAVVPNPTNMFQILQDLSSALNSNDHNQVNNIIDTIDSRVDSLLQLRAEIGARINRVELVDNRLKEIAVNLQGLISKTEDTDMAETITNLKTQENVYQASLSAGARIIQPSLVNFLK